MAGSCFGFGHFLIETEKVSGQIPIKERIKKRKKVEYSINIPILPSL